MADKKKKDTRTTPALERLRSMARGNFSKHPKAARARPKAKKKAAKAASKTIFGAAKLLKKAAKK